MYDNTCRVLDVLTPEIVSAFKYEALLGDHLPWETEYLWCDDGGSLKMSKVVGKSGWEVKTEAHDRVWVRFRPKPIVPKALGSVVYHGEVTSVSGQVWSFHHAVKVRQDGDSAWGVFSSPSNSLGLYSDLIMWCGDQHFISFKTKEDS